MIEIPVHKLDGDPAGHLQVDEALLGGEVRPSLLKQAYVMYHANRRQGSAHTRGRSEVEGSSRKLYRQKGTGNARMGTIRSNIRKGGGVAFARAPKSWRQSMPVRMRRLATRNALLSKIVDGEIKVVEKFSFDAPKTKAFAEALNALGVNRSCLLALAKGDKTTGLSARNIPDVSIVEMDQLNAYDLLSRRFLLVEKDVLNDYFEALKSAPAAVEEAA